MLPSSLASITALFTVAVLGPVSQATAVQEEASAEPEIRRWVKASTLNFRRGPGTSHSVIHVLAANEPVRVLERSGQWVRVEWISERGEAIRGWVFGRFLSERTLTEKELQRLRRRPRSSAPGDDLAVLCLVALPTIYLIRRGLASKGSGPATITGKAWVDDADGIKVSGKKIRLARLDAPEWDQWAIDQRGMKINHGRRVRSALIRKIGGKNVRVTVLESERDPHSRVLGIVTCNGEDVNAWLVRNGYAIAAYGDRYKKEEREARAGNRGQWAYKEKIEPKTWRDHLARRERRSN